MIWSSFPDGNLFLFCLCLVIFRNLFQIPLWFYCKCSSILKSFIVIIDSTKLLFFVFYLIRGLYIWFTMIQTYFMTSLMQQINAAIKDKITNFQFNISRKVILNVLQWLHLCYRKLWFLCYHSKNASETLHQCL